MTKQRFIISQIVTKELRPLSSLNTDQRLFKGILTAEVVDRQGEFVPIQELENVAYKWMARGGFIMDTHSNRGVGKALNFSRVLIKTDDGKEIQALEIVAEIFKHYKLDDEVWDGIRTGRYKGLSFGGATNGEREAVRTESGGMAWKLSDLEYYEASVCETPANPLAIITDYNRLAKSITKADFDKMQHSMRTGNQVEFRCKSVGCYVEKNFEEEHGFSDNESKERARKEADRMSEELQSPVAEKIEQVNKPEMTSTGLPVEHKKPLALGDSGIMQLDQDEKIKPVPAVEEAVENNISPYSGRQDGGNEVNFISGDNRASDDKMPEGEKGSASSTKGFDIEKSFGELNAQVKGIESIVKTMSDSISKTNDNVDKLAGLMTKYVEMDLASKTAQKKKILEGDEETRKERPASNSETQLDNVPYVQSLRNEETQQVTDELKLEKRMGSGNMTQRPSVMKSRDRINLVKDLTKTKVGRVDNLILKEGLDDGRDLGEIAGDILYNPEYVAKALGREEEYAQFIQNGGRID